MTYELLELSGKDPETIVQVLTEGDDFRELEEIRDTLQSESLKTRGSMTLQRFAVRAK